jgi:hypothetical protein
MIILTSRLFDITHSPVLLSEDPQNSSARNVSRRVSRTATLDGSAVIHDGGFADADRTIDVRVPNATQAQLSAVLALIQADNLQRVATEDGVFEGALERITQDGGSLTARFLVQRKLSA